MRWKTTIKRSALAIVASAALALAPVFAQDQERLAEHPMSGEIVATDHDTGALVVNTEPVPMTVHFPKDHVQDLKMGDTITVFLSFEKGAQQ